MKPVVQAGQIWMYTYERCYKITTINDDGVTCVIHSCDRQGNILKETTSDVDYKILHFQVELWSFIKESTLEISIDL